MPPEQRPVLVALISCPNWRCRAEFEGNWLAAEDPGESPEPEIQLCPECGHCWREPYPGYSFTAEA